jgi:hypothetical protein
VAETSEEQVRYARAEGHHQSKRRA